MKLINKTKKKPIITFGVVNGLKQSPKDYDFSITPCLKFGTLPPEDRTDILDDGYVIGIEWGYWAVCLYLTIIKKWH